MRAAVSVGKPGDQGMEEVEATVEDKQQSTEEKKSWSAKKGSVEACRKVVNVVVVGVDEGRPWLA